MADLKAEEYKSFEEIKHREDETEYWLARELAPALEYVKWENFSNVIDRAMLACKNSGFVVSDHFLEVGKTVDMPSGAKPKIIKDYRLSRYACYLIVQNGDPRKEVIALGQTYFAIQTRRQEVQDYFNQLDEDNKRLVIRGDIKQWNQMLAETAHNAGAIDDDDFATFQNAGYMGLYGGETVADIHTRKRLSSKEKIRKESIQGVDDASDAHREVGKIVREAIKQAGGTLPENQPMPTTGITEIERQQIRR